MSDVCPIIACSPSAAGRFLGVSKRRIYELLAAGSISARKDGKRTLVDYKSLQTYFEGLPPRDGEREPLFPKHPRQ